MSKILITGGAGFIGSNFIYYQLKNHPEDSLICLDDLTYAGNISTLRQALEKKQFRFVKGDIADTETVYALFEDERPDYVVNFAAESHVDRSILEPGIFLRTNIMGTQVLMDACLRYGVLRFHQVSTDEVYGELPLDRPERLFVESTPLKPSSPYSASKAAADMLVGAYCRTYKLPATISRCSNNYGPYQFPEKLIPLMISKAASDEKLPVYGRGENIRDWLYVEDHCAAIDMIMRYGRNGEIYNIGGHNEYSNLEVVKTILHVLKKPESLISFVADRPGHDLRYAIDPKKISSELGWYPQTRFSDGILRTIQWYIENDDWLQHILSKKYLEENDKYMICEIGNEQIA